jgi:serine/threonine-protein kinase HipA
MTTMLPEKIRQLDVEIAGEPAGQLLKHSVYEFRYLDGRVEQPSVALLMPPTRPTYQDGDLFAVMDQNLPEGDLYLRLRAMFPKQQLTQMHLLAVVGTNGIGRLGFRLAGAQALAAPRIIDRKTLLATRYTPQVFDELVRAYLSTGAGIAGMQPKIMVPDRVSVPVPTIIVKAGAPSYPGLSANEFMCLTAAGHAGIRTPTFDLSDDGQLLLVDRFDIAADGSRIGFEDIAALMNLRVRDIQSDRKYHGSYQRIAELMRYLQLSGEDLQRFFEQVAFSIMVRNGDGHLKNYGLLYTSTADCRLAPMFDVVTTALYRYTRYEGGPELEDRTLALKLFAGKGHTKAYPTTEELLLFGGKVCGVAKPELVLARIAEGMHKTLGLAAGDQRIPKDLLQKMRDIWIDGMSYAKAK